MYVHTYGNKTKYSSSSSMDHSGLERGLGPWLGYSVLLLPCQLVGVQILIKLPKVNNRPIGEYLPNV
jgi:hypothetical protein